MLHSVLDWRIATSPPHKTRSNRTVLVNRGWVPPDWRRRWHDGVAREQPQGRVVATGAAQGSEEPSGFVPRNEPDKGNFYWLDVPGIVSTRHGGCQ